MANNKETKEEFILGDILKNIIRIILIIILKLFYSESFVYISKFILYILDGIFHKIQKSSCSRKSINGRTVDKQRNKRQGNSQDRKMDRQRVERYV